MKEFGINVYKMVTDTKVSDEMLWETPFSETRQEIVYDKIAKLFKENKELKEENEGLKKGNDNDGTSLELKCDISGWAITEDDLQISLDYGSLICEDEWEKIPDEKKKNRSQLQKEIDELNEKITCLESDSHNEVSQAEFDELKEENEELKKEKAQLLWMHKYERDFRKGLYKDEDFILACKEDTLEECIDLCRDEYEETMVEHNREKDCGFPSIEDDSHHKDVGVLYNNLMDIAEDARRLIEFGKDLK